MPLQKNTFGKSKYFAKATYGRPFFLNDGFLRTINIDNEKAKYALRSSIERSRAVPLCITFT